MNNAQTLPRPSGPLPLRRPHSVRRTTTLDVTWPHGRSGPRNIVGIGRDIYTPPSGGAPEVLAFEELRATVGTDGSLVSLTTIPARRQLRALVGEQRLRRVLANLGDKAFVNTPAYQMIDDIPGAMVVADWAWSRWPQFLPGDEKSRRVTRMATLEGVCVGFRSGSSALATDGGYQDERAAAVSPLANPLDYSGWHHPPEVSGVSMRRARFIDMWCDEDLQLEAGFQDSATTPGERRVAVHEYGLRMRADPGTYRVSEVWADPHVLPFVECPNAIENLNAIVGQSLADLRTAVPVLLRRELGCTHLNDALRSLAGMASLATLACKRSERV